MYYARKCRYSNNHRPERSGRTKQKEGERTMTETILRKENKGEAEAMVKFLEEIGKDNQKEFLIFMQGVKLGRSLNSSNQKGA